VTAIDITLRPATPDEVRAVRPRLAAEYAAEIVASGSLPPAQAQAKAERDVTGLFAEPDGAKDQVVFRPAA
jgi:hypothetical protein